MRKFLSLLLASAVSVALAQNASAQFVAFNDHYVGPNTASNATTWNAFTNANGAPGNWGTLKDIVSGANVPVVLIITNTGIIGGNTAGGPSIDTPAYNVFNGYIDWGTNTIPHAIQMPDAARMGHVLTNLNPSKRYKITCTGIRDGGYSDRWALFDLTGSSSFTPGHTPGCLTSSTIGLTTNDVALNQCVINTGANTAGDLAIWDMVDPGADGTIAILTTVYRGVVPLGSSSGTYGYGITALKVEEFEVLPTPVTITAQPQNRTVNEGQIASFSIVAAGVPYPALQWYRVNAGVTNVIAGATNTSYVLPAAAVADNGAQFFVIAQNTVSNTLYAVQSSSASLTVIADSTAPAILDAFAAFTLTNVTLVFSEPIAATATSLANYSLTNLSLGGTTTILSAVLQNSSNVVLTTRPLTNGSTYVVFVSGVKDLSAAANTIAPSSPFSFVAQSSFVSASYGGATPVATVQYEGATGVNMTGGGADIGGTSDAFQFAYQTRSGDFDLRVRVASLSLKDAWAKAGLMARSANANANSMFAAALATPNLNGCFFQYRSAAGIGAVSGGGVPINYPYTWLRLQRSNLTNWTGYASFDGTTWATLGSIVMAMGEPVYIGYAVSSYANGVANTVQFRDFGDAVNATSAGSITLPVEPLGPSSRHTEFAISEFMYNPFNSNNIPGFTNSLEFIEIYNSEPVPKSLGGWRLSGSIHYSFPSDTVMQPGAFLVIARDPAAVQGFYGISGVLGPWYGTAEKELSGDISGNGLPGDKGTIRLRNRQNAVMLEINYEDKYPWPIAADGAGHSLVLARPSYGEGDVRAWAASDRVFGSPGTFDPITFDPLRNVVINEFLANTHTELPTDDYIELYNHGNQAVDLGGANLTDSPTRTNKFKIPAGTILPARGFRAFTRTELPFGLSTENGRIYLLNAATNKVLDAIDYEGQSAGVALGRSPDGAPLFRELIARTPGTNNASVLFRDIVINEIMYNPITGNTDDEYIELYNKGTNTIDLKNWRFTSGISFKFTNSLLMAPDSYVVVARNRANLVYKYSPGNPALSAMTVGNFEGNLANSGERIVLEMPELVVTTNRDNILVTNTIYIVANEVTYGDGGRWGNWSDGGGSSLELIDPRSDNRYAANWADSDETGKAEWTDMEITHMPLGDNQYTGPNNLHVYLLDGGECLVDNVQVVNSTNGQNFLYPLDYGTFEPGVVLANVDLALLNANGGNLPITYDTNWLVQGAYDFSTIDPTGGFNNSACLHLRGATHGDTGPNKIRSPMFPTNAIGLVTMRAKVKWLRGWPEILFRLHGGHVDFVGKMNLPNTGTPGLPNSRLVANAGPAIGDVVHSPVLPLDGQPTVVTARAFDPDGIGSFDLLYRVDPETNFTAVPMLDNGSAGDEVAGDGLFSARIPGQATGSIVAFYLRAIDSLGVTNLFPQDMFPQAPLNRPFPCDSYTRECVYRVGDRQMPGSFSTYHFFMTGSSVNRWLNREPRSNGSIDMTFAYNNSRVIYNAVCKSGGSPFHRGQQVTGPIGSQRTDYDVSIPSDDGFFGENGFNIGYPGNTSGGDGTDKTALAEKMSLVNFDEMLVSTPNRRFIHLFINGNQRSKISGRTGNFIVEDAVRPNAGFIRHWYPDDPDGELTKLDDWFEFNEAASAFSNNDADLTRRVVTVGGKTMIQTNRYRFQWQRRSDIGGSLNNWSNFVTLLNAISPTTADYAPVDFVKMNEVADIEQWAHEIAGRHMVGDFDAWGYDRGKNNYQYKPNLGRIEFLPFDVDWSMGQSSRGATEDIFKTSDPRAVAMYTNAEIRRVFLRAYQNLIDVSFNNNFLNPRIDQYTAVFTANGIDFDPSAVNNMKTFIQQRRDYVAGVLSGQTNDFNVATPPTVTTGSNFLTLTGYAPVKAKSIRINGIEYPVTWNSVNNWSINLYVNSSTNSLVVQAFDRFGNPYPKSLFTNTVIYTNAIAPLPGTIVINEIMYNPTSTNASYIELVNTSSNYTFDISGWRLNGLADYTFPGGSFITNGQYIILAKNRTGFADAYGYGIPVFDTYTGGLDNDGETLTLIKPALNASEKDVIIDRVRYEATAPWPANAAGLGASLQLVDAAQDNSRVGNWSGGVLWRYYSFTGNPVTAAGTLYMFPSGSASPCDFFLDDVRLVFGTDAGAGTNLIRNGDFETGSNTYWGFRAGVTNSTVTPTVSHGGSYSLHVIASGAGGINFAVIQGIAGYKTSTNYTLSYWYLPGTNVSALTTQIGDLRVQFTAVNTNFFWVPYTPGAANSVASTATPFESLWLNEVQARNTNTRTNRFGEFVPWVELYNGGQSPIDLGGYYLANNYSSNVMQWAFPAGTFINSGEFKLVWLDANAAASIPEELHANFTIPATNGSVALTRYAVVGTNVVSQVVDYLNYGNLGSSLSYGDYPDGQPFTRQVFYSVTPQRTNDATHRQLYINEWMAQNVEVGGNGIPGFVDPADRDYDDWFELYNPNDYQINLGGYFMTDNTNFPALFARIPQGYVVPPHGFLLVWADNETGQNEPTNSGLHVNFALSRSGEQIAVYDPQTNLVDFIQFGPQTNNISEGRFGDGNESNRVFMGYATPGTPNLWFQNHAPEILPVSGLVITQGQTLSYTVSATDVDAALQSLTYHFVNAPLPGASMTTSNNLGFFTWTPTITQQTLAFSLEVGPTGSAINPGTGVFTWTPLAPGNYPVTVRVTDNGVPALSVTTSFTIIVADSTAPRLAINRQGQVISVSWPESPNYSLQQSTSLGIVPAPNWVNFTGNLATNNGTVSGNIPLSTNQFFRLYKP